MTTLTVTAKGQITLKQELLQHLGVNAGQKIEVELMPGGKAMIRPARHTHDISAIFGILKSKNKENICPSIEEINETIAKGWAGER
ncbi:MAG: AbrB/MazE/SpoVT family DNA-binding domain-containing protein [Azoarcus sp.]|jgi:bifunctional DNA-binding transcriptional regulator/antitoxin component of YhaV-PrlF toxin-antitoxin module|nr:AbrB/MazE/SpoVT family DNA-binding domain-containing protein [Azoarcus sp.]